MSKIYQGNFQSLCRLAQLLIDTFGSHFREKERHRSRKLRYQEIDVQIQTFTDEN